MASIPGVRFDITGASGSQGLLSPKSSWRAYVFPRGAYAKQDSSGAVITLDSADVASRYAVNNWIQVGLSTANIRQVAAVGGNSINVTEATTVSENDRVFIIGDTEPTVVGGSATYTHPNTVIRERDDDSADVISNSMVTSNSNGLIQFFSGNTPSGITYFDCLIQDGDQSNQGSIIDVEVGTPGSNNGVHNVINYGAAGNGVTDDTAAIQLAIDTAGSSGTVYFPPGEYFIANGSTLNLDSSLSYAGAGASSVLVKGAADTSHCLTADAKTDVIIRDLAFKKNAANSASDGAAIRLVGACADIVVENVLIDQFALGVDVEGAEGTTASTATRIACRRVNIRNTLDPSAGQWGFGFGDATHMSLENCVASGMWLDGIKTRRMTSGVKVTNCVMRDNGKSGAGDGIDTFAGGDELSLVNLACDANTGAGINIKCGELNRTGATEYDIYGICRNVTVTGCHAVNNTGKGILVNRSSAAGVSDPLPANIILSNCYSGENGAEGFYIRGRNVVMQGCISRKNDAMGILVLESSLDVRVDGCIVVANSQAAAGSVHGIELQGARCSVDNCIIQGAEGNTITQNSDYGDYTQYQNRPIRVTDDASDVWIGPNNVYQNHSADDTVKTDDITGSVQAIVDEITTLDLSVSGIQAGPGSFARRWNASNNPMLFLKVSGYTATGWTPVPHPGVSPDVLPDEAEPSIKANWMFRINGTTNTTITDFSDALGGQVIYVRADTQMTIANDAAKMVLQGATDWTMAADDTLTLGQWADGVWHELARSDNT